MITMITGQHAEKATRVSDIIFYQRMYFEDRLKHDTHARFEAMKAEWQAEGAIEDLKPEFLDALRTVARERWQRETPEFRAEVRAANKADYEERAAEARKRKEEEIASRTPKTPAQYERYASELYDVCFTYSHAARCRIPGLSFKLSAIHLPNVLASPYQHASWVPFHRLEGRLRCEGAYATSFLLYVLLIALV